MMTQPFSVDAKKTQPVHSMSIQDKLHILYTRSSIGFKIVKLVLRNYSYFKD